MAGSRKTAKAARKVAAQNVNVPGYTHLVDADMYAAMRRAFLRALPSKAPGLTQAEIRSAVLPSLPRDLFPKGAKAGWWSKTVQLDLEAKRLVVREASKPLRWHKVR